MTPTSEPDLAGATWRVLVAPNAFKGCLAAPDVAAALAAGLRAGWPALAPDLLPVADGGEGTVAALVAATSGALAVHEVEGPLGAPVKAALGLLGDGTAVVEVAAASGLALLPPGARDARRASSFGTGELLRRAALEHGARRVIVGLGGSACTDGGAGLAQALGARLLDADGRDLPRGGAALARLARLDVAGVPEAVRRLAVVAACDVDAPLVGPRGAAAVFGPQKGADPAAVAELDAGLARLAEVARRDLGPARPDLDDLADRPGAGAAGGLGAGLLALLGATLRPGADLVLDAAGFDARVRGAALVVTGEGRLDAQTLRGKAPLAVARRARAAGVPVVAVAGDLRLDDDALRAAGLDAALPLTPGPLAEAEAVARAPALLHAAGARLARLLALGRALPAPGRSPPDRPPPDRPPPDRRGGPA